MRGGTRPATARTTPDNDRGSGTGSAAASTPVATNLPPTHAPTGAPTTAGHTAAGGDRPDPATATPQTAERRRRGRRRVTRPTTSTRDRAVEAN